MKSLPQNPLVSIVTPSYNTGRYIEETLCSVRDQNYPLIEHIVLDSGSTDDTPNILKRFPSLRLIAPAPANVPGKLDLGFSIAQGDIVGWLCADDCYLPGAVARVVEAFKRHPEAGMVYCNFLQVDENSVKIDSRRSKQAGLPELLNEELFVPAQGAFMRAEALESVGLRDPRYPLLCDWDMWIRIAKLYPIVYVDDWWGAFRVHREQLSNTRKYEYWIQARRMTRSHGARFFSPLFWNYWGGKAWRAALLLQKGQFSVFNSKLRDLRDGFRNWIATPKRG